MNWSEGISPESLADVMDGAPVPIDLLSGKPFEYINGKIFSNAPVEPAVAENMMNKRMKY